MVARLRRFFDIRAGEGLPVLLSFSYIAFVVASFLLAKAVRNGLFIQQYGPYALIYVYAASPLVLSLFVPVYTQLAARIGPRRITVGMLVFFSLNVMLFWWRFRLGPSARLIAIFYVWVNCFGVIAPVHAWSYASSLFDTRQAKRLFGLIGSGASLGAITGGFLARVLVGPMGGSVNLLLILALLILIAALVVAIANTRIRRRGLMSVGRSRRESLARTWREIASKPYHRLILAVVVVGAIVTQWVTLQLNLVAANEFGQNATALTRFNGTFTLALGSVSLLVQLFATGQALRRFGLAVTIMALPLSLGLSTALIVMLPAFWPVLVTSGFDQALRFSVDKPTYELLYLPILPAQRVPVKHAIDIVGTRIADAVGAVLYGTMTVGFLIIPGLRLTLRGTAAVNLVLIACWLVIAWRLRKEYVRTIQDSIHRHRIDSERISAATLERSAADALRNKLGAKEAGDVRYALDLLEGQRTRSWDPALRTLLLHPEPDIRRRALALLAGAGDREIANEAVRLLRDPDLGVRNEALLYLSRELGLDPLAQIERLGDFADFSIRASMATFLASPGPGQNLEAARTLVDAMLSSSGPEGARERTEVARLVGVVPDGFVDVLVGLLADPDEGVVREAIRSARLALRLETIEPLVAALARPELTDEAAAALARFGNDVVSPVARYLSSDDTPVEVKRELPSVLVRIGSIEAEHVLIESLLQADVTLRHRVVASLNKLRVGHPDIAVDPQVIELLLAAEIAGHYRSYQVLGPLQARLQDDDPVLQAMQHSMEQELERIFRLMALLLPQSGLHDAYVGVRSENPLIRANALEFLDNVLKPELRQTLVPLLDSQVSVQERIDLANRFVGAPLETPEQAVSTLLASEDAWLRSCAVYAIGALQLEDLQGELSRFENATDPVLRDSVRNARRRLAGETDTIVLHPPAPPAIDFGAG
jgi:AAA family ATP:ADP antiporter